MTAFACPYDPLSPEQLRDPYPAWAERPPVFYDERLGMWSVTGYEEVLAVLRDTATFSSADAFALRAAFRVRACSWPRTHPSTRSCASACNAAFTPRRVAEMEPFIAQTCHELAEALQSDLMAEYANALPLAGDHADPRLRPRRRPGVAPMDRGLPRPGDAGRGSTRTRETGVDRPHGDRDGAQRGN